MTICLVAAVLFMFFNESKAVIFWDDGLVHNIDSVITDDLSIGNVQVNLFSGGDIQGSLTTSQNSKFTSYGGIIEDSVWVFNNSDFTFNDGTIKGWLIPHDNSQVEIYGGKIGVGYSIYSNEYSNTIVFGGEMLDPIVSRGHSMVSIWGGNIEDTLYAQQWSTIVVNGTDFNFNYGLITQNSGTLTGILSNGQRIDVPFNISDSGSIMLIPEPATLLLSGLVRRLLLTVKA